MMSNQPASLGMDNISPSTHRTMGFGSTFAMWLAANVVITSVLTGMLFIPDLTFYEALTAILVGSLIGAVPLALTGRIGTRTGLSTMVMARAAFGQKGAILPALVNTFVLIGWSWIQAYLAGVSLNYAVEQAFGYSNIVLFVVATEVLVVAIAIYGHRGIEALERLVSVLMLGLSLVVFYVMFSSYDTAALIEMKAAQNPELSLAIAFDIVIATAFSWMSSVCDFNRYCKTERASVWGTYLGYVLASLIAMGLGVTVAGFSLLAGVEKTYDPTVLLAASGYGLIASIVVFFSVLSTNVMALYSASFSLLTAMPKSKFWHVALAIGLVCIAGALLQENLMTSFFNFVLLVSTLFIPIFAIILTDFFVFKKSNYDAEEIASDVKGSYRYCGGFNIAAYLAYGLGATFAYHFTYSNPLDTGSSVLTFLVTSATYCLTMALSRSARETTVTGAAHD
jgi:putative hydroxymethylpyrimidine transporter CytX